MSETKRYDVAIIGAGLAGIFAGYELTSRNPDLKVIILEQGTPIIERSCPIISKKVDSCINCKPCAITVSYTHLTLPTKRIV